MAEIFEKEDSNYTIDVPKEKRYLNSVAYDYSVQYIYDLIHRGKIILEVPFQRNQIWKADKASALVESIIMNVPIPPLYFAEEADGKWLVLDGLQRLSSIKNFYDNEFPLTKLDVLSELNKLKYKDLPPKSKSLLDDGMLRVNVIKKDSHRDIKYDIFMRLNRGAVTLNNQELRNCLYRGNLNDAAKELCCENTDFLHILRQKRPHPRFLDVEFVIRYFAFSNSIQLDGNGKVYIQGYKGKLIQFLNEFMDANKNCSLEEKKLYKDRFNSTIKKVVIVFGTDNAFRDINSSKKTVNKAIADFIMPSIERMPLEYVEQNKEIIYSKLKSFLANDTIRNSLAKHTTDRDVVNLRLRMWFEEFEDVISI